MSGHLGGFCPTTVKNTATPYGKRKDDLEGTSIPYVTNEYECAWENVVCLQN